MRDPQRIDRILEKLRREWLNQPDTRLMQLLLNLEPCRNTKYAIFENDIIVDSPYNARLYHVEDDLIEAVLDA